MDWPTFTVEMMKALAWPFVVLAVLLLYRPEVRGLLQRVKRGKLMSAEFEFEGRVAELRDRIGTTPTTEPAVPSDLAQQAERDPRAVILTAWLEVQAVVDHIVARHATAADARGQGSVSLRVLHRLLHDTPEHIDAYNDLKDLRNRAVHDTSFSPRPSSVVEYAALAKSLAAALRPLSASTLQTPAAP